MQMKESVFYGAENGEDLEVVNTEEQTIFVFIRQ